MGGIIFTAALGGTFIGMALLEKKLSINEKAVQVVMQSSKFVLLGYLVYVVYKAFM